MGSSPARTRPKADPTPASAAAAGRAPRRRRPARRQAGIVTSPESAADWHRLGSVLAARGRYTEALDALLAAAERDKQLGSQAVRERMVEIFHVIGMRSDVADDYRDRLQKLLY